METGTVYKKLKMHGFIRPDRWKATRKDIVFDPRLHDLKIGDRVQYFADDVKDRKIATKIEKIQKKVQDYR